MFAFINGFFSIAAPFISATVSLTIAFTVVIWFTLSMIYALSEIINFLLGQPLVGWLVTGDINTSNNLKILLEKGAFRFDAPIMIFIITAMILSVFVFIFYFFWSAMPFNSKERGSISVRATGILMIFLIIIWLPTLYFILVIGTSGLLVALSTFLSLKRQQDFTEQINLMALKNDLINNLEKLKEFKSNLDFNVVNLESEEVKDFVNKHFSSIAVNIFPLFTNIWNDTMSDRFLTTEKIDEWIALINSLNLEDLNQLVLTTEQRNLLFEIARFSTNLNLLNQYYDSLAKFFYTPEIKNGFNSLFLTIKNDSYPNLSEFNMRNIFALNNLSNSFEISNFVFLLTDKASILNSSFSQTIVNILYSLALGRTAVFVPGWESGWNVIAGVPSEISSPLANVTVNLFYNIKMLAIGGIVNAIVLPSLMVFAFLLLKRFLYIAFWPIMILFRLAKTGTGDKNIVKEGFVQLISKFLSIVAIALMWNFIAFLTVSIFDGLQQLTFFKDKGQGWVNEIFQLIVIIGLLAASFALIKEFIEIFEQDRFLAKTGVQEVASAKNKASTQTQRGQKIAQANIKNFKTKLTSESAQGVYKNIGVGVKNVATKMAGRFKQGV